MTRTLVIGIPLPHVTFDNYSFASAPAISDYRRLIVEMLSASGVVEDVVAGSAGHRTFGGQPLVNGPGTSTAFGLADLLAMRTRETREFFAAGGRAVLIAYPQVEHQGIAGLGPWRRYDWLPPVGGIDWSAGLLPGFGGKAPIALTDPGHPFAPYIEAHGAAMAYRATVAEAPDGSLDVFARTAGGAAAAVEAQALAGRVVLLPPLRDPGANRGDVADTLFACFERWEAADGGGDGESSP